MRVRQLEHTVSPAPHSVVFPFCFISCNLLLHSFPVGTLFGSVFFDFVPVSLLGPFWLYQVLVPDDIYQIPSSWFPKMQRILSIISWLVKIINWYSAESKWQCRVSGLFIIHAWTHQKLSSKLINMIAVTNVQQMNWTVLFCVIIYYRLNSIIVSLFILLIIYQSVFDRVISRLSCLKPVAYIISVVSHIGVSE